MKLATVRTADGTIAARLDGDTFTEIPGHTDVGALLRNENWRTLAAEADGRRIPAAGTELDTVVPNPSKVLCTGLNYTGHIEEMGRGLPSHPTLFTKFADTLTGPADPVAAVPEDPEMDWEGELAVVVRRTAYKVTEDESADCIAGYTVANDISMRGWQYEAAMLVWEFVDQALAAAQLVPATGSRSSPWPPGRRTAVSGPL
ncbi:fumarylacetoacetate hydrolase family protein [Streptomyces sp. NPDC057729]|uniref:fumarylacetoacetate hydrolase family protein n=1 Tax=Streptomyces sp. NPDC057729 TaxID=3346230 RepID=UPI0036CFB64E